MNFRNLPPHIQEGVKQLPTDKEFQHRFATDKILDEIDEMKTNMADEYKSLMLVFNLPITVNEVKIKSITPAMWSFLWVLDSPFVNYEKNVNEVDVDLFFYILNNGIGDGDPVRLISESLQYTSTNLQITYDEGLKIISSMVKLSFKPLNMFPKSLSSGNKNLFDADWLTALTTKVHSVTGYSPDYIMYEMPLTTACFYFAQYKRMNGSEDIYKRTDEEILILEDKRASELVVDRLIEKGIFPIEERERWLKEITTPHNKK